MRGILGSVRPLPGLRAARAALLFWAFAALPGCKDDAGTSKDAGTGAGASTTGAAHPAHPSGAGPKLAIAVIPKGTTHEFWKSVQAGAEDAGRERGVNILWKGPLKEDDREQQIRVLDQFVGDRVAGIVLAPLDDTALARPVKAATAQKIPVVVIDSGLKAEPGKDFVSFVATNNRRGGFLGGEELAKALGGKGKLVMLRYQEGSASTAEREGGFEDAIKSHADMAITVTNRYGGATSGQAKDASLNLMDDIKAADGVFCPNESSTLGMLLALRQFGLAGKIKFVGFDTPPPLIDALRKGEIHALVAQDPRKMGYTGVITLLDSMAGKKVETYIDTGVRVITRANLDDAEIKKLLAP